MTQGAGSPCGTLEGDDRQLVVVERDLAKRGPCAVLTRKLCGVSVAFGTASFFMQDQDKTVRVDVCQRLLAGLEEPAPTTKAQFARRLLRYRARFAQIASAKYDEGQFDLEVNVFVVRITALDLG
jgi:hypothetical protein